MPAAGFTLIELLVVLALVGLLIGLTPLALPRAGGEGPAWQGRLAAARLAAAREGREVTIHDSAGRAHLALPDGSVLGPGVDLLTGAVDATAR